MSVRQAGLCEKMWSPYKKTLSPLVSTGGLLVASLQDAIELGALRYEGGWREEESESAGSNKQLSPILKGQKSWKGFIGTIKKTWNRCYVSLIKKIITSHQ